MTSNITAKNIENYQTTNRFFKRGDIWMADLGDEGKLSGEQKGYRPVLIIQNDLGNDKSPAVIVLTLSSSERKAKKRMATHVQLEGLQRTSVVLAEQIATISKDRLCKFITNIEGTDAMADINIAVMKSLGLVWIGEHNSVAKN